ncbi:hypothetical protein AMTRI_Chr07g77570 [Amborella trichopoda]
MDSFLFLGTHTRFITTKRMMITPPICNLLPSCLASKDLPPWFVERLIHSDRHESPTTLHCQNQCCIFESAPPFSARPTKEKCRTGANSSSRRKDSPSRDH